MVIDDDKTLEETIEELGVRARKDYLSDPVGSAIEYLKDDMGEMEAMSSPEFMEGYRHAIYDLEYHYISSDPSFSCKCESRHPEKSGSGSWVCGICGQTIVGEDEDTLVVGGYREADDKNHD